MATYAVGDVQGCYDQLLALLDLMHFESDRDTLWLAGDLINRGPKSLEVLRFVRGLGDAAVCVLGNHDLHLLAAHYGYRRPSNKDTLSDVLDAPDCEELVAWLRTRKLAHRNRERDVVMVHAGLPPEWSVDDALEHAGELETVLSDDDALNGFLERMYGDSPRRWCEDLTGADRLRYITNAFTRIRYVGPNGELDLGEKRPPGRQDPHLTPWFAVPGRASEGTAIVFGHWATLQIERTVEARHGVIHLDTGCVWGGALTGMRLDDGARYQVAGWRAGKELDRGHDPS